MNKCGTCSLSYGLAPSIEKYAEQNDLPIIRTVHVLDCGCRVSKEWYSLFLAIKDSNSYVLIDSLNHLCVTGAYKEKCESTWTEFLACENNLYEEYEGSRTGGEAGQAAQYWSIVNLDLLLELVLGSHTPNYIKLLKDSAIKWVYLISPEQPEPNLKSTKQTTRKILMG